MEVVDILEQPHKALDCETSLFLTGKAGGWRRRGDVNCEMATKRGNVLARLRPARRQRVVYLLMISDNDWMINTMLR